MNEKESEREIELTPPVNDDSPAKPKRKFFQRRSSWFILGILVVVLIILLGGVLGIPRGISDRIKLAETQSAPKIQLQMESARLDIEEGRFEVALGRLDWLLEEMTPFLSEEELAEVGELYSQTLLQMTIIETPVLQSSPTPDVILNTPTPDIRGQEELFTTAQQQIASQSWNDAVKTLVALREKDIDYRTVQVDGMLYVALRNRGVQKILQDGSLEPGIYDLTLAERFAPLDGSAEGFRVWARQYLTGASYWGVDWGKAVTIFEQVYGALPSMRDGTNMTAKERYRVAAINYGAWLAGSRLYCEAQEYFDKAMALGDDPVAQPTAQWVADECWKQRNPPTPEPTLDVSTPTPTPTPQDGTEEPTPTPTEP